MSEVQILSEIQHTPPMDNGTTPDDIPQNGDTGGDGFVQNDQPPVAEVNGPKSQDDVLRRSDRKQTLTNKGKSYTLKTIISFMKSCHRRLKKQVDILLLLLNGNNPDSVTNELNTVEKTYSEFAEQYARVCMILSQDETEELIEQKEEVSQLMESTDEMYLECKEKACSWLLEKDKENISHKLPSGKGSDGSGSSKSGSKSSKSGSKSRSGSSKHTKSTSSDRSNLSLRQKAKVAGLKAEALALKEAKEAELSAELSRLEVKIKKAEAMDKVYSSHAAETQVRERQTHNNDDSKQEDTIAATTPRETLPTDFVTTTQIQAAMIDMVKLQSAPKPELDSYSGDPLEYLYFKANFQDIVESSVKDQRGRLTRLIYYTEGDAKDLIKHLVHDNVDCYTKAINLLDKEYGNPHVLSCSYLKELRGWKLPKEHDAPSFKKLYRFLLKCQAYKSSDRLQELDSTDIIKTVISKVHTSIQGRWVRKTHEIRRNHSRDANFDDLVGFMERESEILSDPAYSRDALADSSFKSNHALYDTKPKVSFPVCSLCKSTHDIEDCEEFLKQSLDQRHKIVFREGLCFGCLNPVGGEHVAKTCAGKRKCRVCNEDHPTTLHGGKGVSSNHTNVADDISMCVVPVEIWHQCSPDHKVVTYALLDDCSQGTFIRDDVLESLSLENTQPSSVSITTLNGTHQDASLKVDGLIVRSMPSHAQSYTPFDINLPSAFSRPVLAVEKEEIPTPSKISSWPHLYTLMDKIPEYDPSIPIGLMIGGNCPKALEPMEVIHSVGEGPYAKRTRLGWCVVGPMGSTWKTNIKSNHTRFAIPVVDVSTGTIASHCFTPNEPIRESYAANILNEMYQNEFNESQSEKRALSQEDERFLEIMESGALKEGNKHILPLPFRNENISFPNNKHLVKGRLMSLKRQLGKDPERHAAYKTTMDWLISNYARKADTSKDAPGKVWRVPHHGVVHPKKKKLRVVFDVSAKCDGVALNTELLQGPDMANSLVGVLARFRKGEIALMADIEAMYYQVLIPESQRSFFRFFWWEDGNLDGEVQEYEMCAHVFGAVSSGGCANYALKKTANEGESEFGHVVAETIRIDFYVDDWLKSVDDVPTAKALVSDAKKLCSTGGFNLTKFISNSREVIDSVPVGNRASSVVDLDLLAALPVERALGVHWCVENDTLGFRVVMKDSPLTRRTVLGTVSSIFDPLGLVSAFVLPGRKILQKVTQQGGCWDDVLPPDLRAQWEKWRAEMFALQDLKIERCYKPLNFKVARSTLHNFSDASDYGYGSASYLRQVSVDGEVAVSLVMAKSRVVPLKTPTTVPRMELTASLVSAKVAALLQEQLDIDNLPWRFWVDNMIVLGYIQNDTKRFRRYVANRSKKIRDITEKNVWSHILTDQNPADDASRGLSIYDTEKVKRWFYGPDVLRQSDCDTVAPIVSPEIADDDPEVIVEMKCNTVQTHEDEHLVLNSLGKRVSSWTRMVRLLSALIMFVWSCFAKTTGMQMVKDVVGAEEHLLRLIQNKHFSSEISALKSKKPVAKCSRVRNLSPFLDEKGIMRVGGRLQKTAISDTAKNPVILPAKEPVVTRFVQWCHSKVQHLGKTTTLGEIRARGYWLLRAQDQVRRVIFECVTCRALRGMPVQQKMGELPESRSGDAPPFTYCGVDLFGPFVIKERRSELKRYGVVFTCLGCRAVHLETTTSLDTDSFILSLRRFLGRRGPVRSIRSDNGGNFVGCDNEMKKGIKEMDHQKIKGFLLSQSCDWEWVEWEFNPPLASHMGGVWERQIRTIRSVLSSLFKEHGSRLNDESLRTLLIEVEAIINSRPLTADSLSDETVQPLCPSNVLTMKTKVILPPPGVFQRADVYCRKRWRMVQHLANEFWTRWRKEYLMGLQERQKWDTARPNLGVGDIVLLVDDDVKRNMWPMGRIVEVFPGDDGLVRKVNVRTATSTVPLSRSVVKVVLLLKCPPSE